MADLIVQLPGDIDQEPLVSTVQTLTIDGRDFAGKVFSVVSCETFDTGLGALNAPLMPVPSILMGIFGTEVTLELGSGGSDYDPETGEVEPSDARQVTVKGVTEGYTIEEKSEIPEIQENDLKLYLSGQDLGYESAALILLQIRQIGFGTSRVEQ